MVYTIGDRNQPKERAVTKNRYLTRREAEGIKDDLNTADILGDDIHETIRHLGCALECDDWDTGDYIDDRPTTIRVADTELWYDPKAPAGHRWG